MSDTPDCTTRICTDCGQEFPLTKQHFRQYKDKTGAYYFQRRCLLCIRKIDKQRYVNHDGAAKMRDWRHNNPIKAKEAKHRSESRHPETVKARKQRSHIRCKDKNNLRSKIWNDEHKEYVSIKSREYYTEHRQEIIDRVIQYQKDNPEIFRSIQHRRRGLEKNAEGSFSTEDLVQMYEDQGGHCAYCGIGIFWDIPKDVHIEHMKPLSRGGSNWPDNIRLTCASCNLSKGDKTVAEWEVIRGW